jgi:chromate transporter
MLARPRSHTDLFLTFTVLALQGFGGVLAIAQQTLCEKKRWLERAEFLEILAAGQVLPGPNVCNVALMVGDRFFGWRGAFAALAGMMCVPLLIVLVLTATYTQFATEPLVAGALKGMGLVSAGLIAGTALKLCSALRSNPVGVPAAGLCALSAFVLVGLLRLPVAAVLLSLGALACGFAWRRIGPAGDDETHAG